VREAKACVLDLDGWWVELRNQVLKERKVGL
jgi:hypothetical protein